MSTRWDSEKIERILWVWSASIHFRECLLAQMRALWFVLKRDFKNTINPCGISKHPVSNIYYYLMPGWDSDPVPDLRWNPLGFYGGKGGDWQHVTCLTHMWYVCLTVSWTFVTAKYIYTWEWTHRKQAFNIFGRLVLTAWVETWETQKPNLRYNEIRMSYNFGFSS